MSAYRLLLIVHVLAGTVALISFWVAAFAKKGSKIHLRSGDAYMLAMLTILITAVPIAIAFYLRGIVSITIFLAYLIVIVGTNCLRAWRAVRNKGDARAYASPAFRVLAVVNIVAGVAVQAAGWYYQQPIFVGFSLIGLLTGGSMLRFALRPPQDKRWWFSEHYRAMIGNGVATHIAFLSVGLGRLIPELQSQGLNPIAWFGPVAVALAVRFWLDRKYFRPLRVVRAQALVAMTDPRAGG
jgi:hypothetical protein